MIITGRAVLHEFVKAHADAENWISNWIADTEGALWKAPQDVKDKYRSVSFFDSFVIFNVKGNRYRLEVQISYNNEIVNVVWAGTHAEYDKRNKKR